MLATHKRIFKEYLFLDKVIVGSMHVRLTVMVKDGNDVQRLPNLENNVNPSIILKIKTGPRKFHILISNYRQWKGTSPGFPYNSRSDAHAQLRLREMINLWQNCNKLGHPTSIIGDSNIDRLEVNDPES